MCSLKILFIETEVFGQQVVTNQSDKRGERENHRTVYTSAAAAAAAKSLQSCPTLCNPIDSSPPDSPVPGILQARTLEWAAILKLGSHKLIFILQIFILVSSKSQPNN